MTAWLLGALIGVPALVGLALLASASERLAGPVGVATGAVVAALAVAVAVARPSAQAPMLPGQPLVVAVDTLSAALILTVATVALMVLLFTYGSPEHGRRRLFGLLLLFTAAMLATVTAANLLTLLIAWELMGAASYALIGHSYRERRRVWAGTTAFLTTRTADVGLYVAAGAAFASGTAGFMFAESGWAQAAAAGIVVAALGKSAQLPFSGWLSGAMLGPSPVSALLHSATMVAAGAYLLLRVHPLLVATGWDTPVAWVGAVTAVVMGAVALAQHDLKQLLAASTCAQVGFMVLAAGTGSIAGGVAALVAHAATKALLFLAAGAWLDALGTKDMAALRGVGRRYPAVGAAAALGALSLAGVPPLSLWVGKDAAMSVAAEEHLVLYGVGLVGAVLSAAYGARVLIMILAAPGRPDYDTERRGTRTVSVAGTAAVAVLAVFAAGLGMLGLTPARDVLPGPWASATGLLISGVLSLAAVGAIIALERRPVTAPTVPGALVDWLGLTGGLAAIGHGTLSVAHVLAQADDRGISGVVDGVARGTRALAAAGNTRVEPLLESAVSTVTTGARRLGAGARRLQTGQLHTYYAQAVGALVLLAGLIVLVR